MSVIIPSFNSAEWLPSTVAALAQAVARTELNVELVIVDDGSTDETESVTRQLALEHEFPIRRIAQENQGVFIAVWNGLRAATSERLLILNARLLLDADSLRFVADQLPEERTVETWNGHVATDPGSPLVGRFWEVPTFVFWGGYLGNPRPTLITAANFDRVPKGTGCLIVSRAMLERAYLASWPADDERFTSDDTKLLRYIAAQRPIRLEPGFSAVYRPRTTFPKFLSHARNRGTLFVDSYAGTSALRRLVLLLLVVLPPIAIAALIAFLALGLWSAFWVTIALGLVAVALPAVIARARGCPARPILSYLAFILPFGVAFWSGLGRGLWIHRGAFASSAPAAERHAQAGDSR
jgi:glycosyltransferase involved in cell wall biosynthesis